MLFTCLGTKGNLLKFSPWAERNHLLSQLRECIRYLHKSIVRPRPGGNKCSEEMCAVSSPGGAVLGSIILYGKRKRMRISVQDLSLCCASLVYVSLPKSCQAYLADLFKELMLVAYCDLLFLTLPCSY